MILRRNICQTEPVVHFSLKGGRDAAVEMMDRLKMVAIVTHVADARSCVLHPASHTHRQMNDKELVEAGVNSRCRAGLIQDGWYTRGIHTIFA